MPFRLFSASIEEETLIMKRQSYQL